MMRVSTKAVSSGASVVAVAVALVALTGTTESRAGDESLVAVACAGGAVTVTSADAKFHINKAAPWKWDKGEKVSLDDHAAKFKGAACGGTVSAYVCTNDQSQCKSFKVAVK